MTIRNVNTIIQTGSYIECIVWKIGIQWCNMQSSRLSIPKQALTVETSNLHKDWNFYNSVL